MNTEARVGVEAQEPEEGAQHGQALTVTVHVAGLVGQGAEAEEGDEGDAARQAVEAVPQVDGVVMPTITKRVRGTDTARGSSTSSGRSVPSLEFILTPPRTMTTRAATTWARNLGLYPST
jgi:hypothetical protein